MTKKLLAIMLCTVMVFGSAQSMGNLNTVCNKLTSNRKEKKTAKEIILKGTSEEHIKDPSNVDPDWNLEMINAKDEETKIDKKVKVAVLDSGVDETEGIKVVKRINLIPSEEEVYPVFDDVLGYRHS